MKSESVTKDNFGEECVVKQRDGSERTQYDDRERSDLENRPWRMKVTRDSCEKQRKRGPRRLELMKMAKPPIQSGRL